MSKPKSAVLLCKVPRSFKPSHAHEVPERIVSGKYLARGLSIAKAAAFALAFNRTHLPSTGNYRFRWAVAIADLRRNYEQPANYKSRSKAVSQVGGALRQNAVADAKALHEMQSAIGEGGAA